MVDVFKDPGPDAPASRLLDQRYELLQEVGRGGMAVVYRGRDRRLGNREVAVKVLHPYLATSPDARRRFKREADAVAQLEHENILKVFDASGVDSRDTYIVMEFVHGRTLREIIDARTFRVPEIGAMIAHQVARALCHAHEAGIVHRDVKPENILVRNDGAVKLTDFGIARVAHAQQMTTTGAMIGSPAHMSPEQIEGKPSDERSDVFSLGILLYYTTTGVLPFQAPAPHAVLHKILVGRYEPAERVNPAVGRRLSRIVDKAMERDPADRYQSAAAMLADISDALRELGVDEPALELRAWFADPEGMEQALRERIVGKLLELAERAAVERRRAAALGALDRVLSLDDGNPRAQEMLARLTRQRRWGRVGLAAAALMLVAGGAALGIATLPPAPPALVMPVGRGAESLGGALETPHLAPPIPPRVIVLRAPEEGERPVGLARRDLNPTPPKKAAPVPPPLPPPALADAQIVAFPQGASVTLDGKFIGYGGASGLRLTLGKHTVRLSHATCEPCVDTEHTITVALDKPNVFRLPIKLKPATLTIEANTPASVRIAGNSKGFTGDALAVPMMEDRPTSKKVKVEAPGYKTLEFTVTLEAGKAVTKSVTLQPVAPPL